VFRVKDAHQFVFSNDKDRRRHDGGHRSHANRLARQYPFSQKIPEPKMATTASLPLHLQRLGFTLPFWMYKTLSATSPREKMLIFSELLNLSRCSDRLEKDACVEGVLLRSHVWLLGRRRLPTDCTRWHVRYRIEERQRGFAVCPERHRPRSASRLQYKLTPHSRKRPVGD
jgi:hypothetical protein